MYNICYVPLIHIDQTFLQILSPSNAPKPRKGPLGPLLKEPSRHTLAVPASTTPWCQTSPIERWTWGLFVTIFLTIFHVFCNDVLRDLGRFRGSKLLFFCGERKVCLWRPSLFWENPEPMVSPVGQCWCTADEELRPRPAIDATILDLLVCDMTWLIPTIHINNMVMTSNDMVHIHKFQEIDHLIGLEGIISVGMENCITFWRGSFTLVLLLSLWSRR